MAREFPSLPEQRETIHDLIIQMHRSGLSPPEMKILEETEAMEALLARSNDSSGLLNITSWENIYEYY